MKNAKFLFRFIKPHFVSYFLGLVVLGIVDYASLFVPKITGELVDGLESNAMGMDGVMNCIYRILLVGAIMMVGRFLWRIFLMLTARKVEYDIRNELFKHLETMDVEYYNEHKVGGLMAHFTQDLSAVRQALGPAVLSAFDATVMAAMVIIRMLRTANFRLTGIIIIPMLCIMLGELWFGKWVHKVYKRMQKAFEDLSDFVQESISGARVIKAFVREKAEGEAFEKQNALTRAKNMYFMKMIAIEDPILRFVIGLSSLITLFVGGKMVLRGNLSLGSFVAFTQYIAMLVWPMIAAGDAINMFSRGTASISRLNDIFESTSEVQSESPEDVPDEEIRTFKGEITFKDLTFIHRDHLEPTLKHISLDIKPGTTVAVIGRTGSGKSTLVNLLLHLYQVNRGMIFFDGKDIRDIPLNELRNNIAYVPQDNFLFSDTLENNIAFSVGKASRESVRKAAKQACIDEAIMEFPENYETVVGERGVTLSGGQKQRSSIARALIKDAPILILDDSLSAVDTDTEEKILKNLKEVRAGRTTIIIAHRITTIQNADVIMVIDEGELAECGNHHELMQLNGIYKDMFDKQQLEAMKASQEGGIA
ncbi:MAG: ABC transporter ATP-binding protein [Lachnospiraceae bacterium]|nr:ABC transporter ATP-binding protein [Lachnospiraceae bacterium]